jgi:Ca2+-binding RTX toxin-like protein
VAGGALRYQAARGESNNVLVRPIGSALIVRDDSVRAGRGCRRLNARNVRCTVSRRASIILLLGNENDRANVSHLIARRATLDGGPGDDYLDGGAGRDLFIGGPGDDGFEGDGGRDHAVGGAGDDSFVPGDGTSLTQEGPRVFARVDADRFDGGAGSDRISYSGRRDSLFVDLGDRATDGARREGDVLRSVEGVDGSEARDRLAGNAQDNFISAGGGNDRVDGGRGDDDITGGDGDDVLHGGDGDDDIQGEEGNDVVDGGDGDDFVSAEFAAGAPQTLRCGAGNDIVWGTYHSVENSDPKPLPAAVEATDVLIPDDCERVARFGRFDVIASARPLAIEPAGARMRVSWRTLYNDSATGFVQLDSGTAQFTVPPNGAVEVVVPLSAEMRARIAAGGAVLRGALALVPGDRIVAWSVRVNP